MQRLCMNAKAAFSCEVLMFASGGGRAIGLRESACIIEVQELCMWHTAIRPHLVLNTVYSEIHQEGVYLYVYVCAHGLGSLCRWKQRVDPADLQMYAANLRKRQYLCLACCSAKAVQLALGFHACSAGTT